MENIIGFVGFYFAIIAVIALYRGLLYDNAKEKETPNYKDNHFLIPRGFGRIRATIPHYVKEESKNPNTVKLAKSYNRIVTNFWITVAILAIMYFSGKY